MGKSLSRQIEKEFKISNDAKLKNRLEEIGEKIALVSDRQDLEYHFFVIEDKELNAFAIPGGNVYVNDSILNSADDDELACVVAHEIGHIAARHSVKKMQAVLGYQIIKSVAFSKAGSVQAARAIDVMFNIISLGYSREDERLADRLAIKYSFKSGFNPRGMVTFLYKLEKDAKEHGRSYHLVFLESHPPLGERMRNMEQEIYNLQHPKEPSENASKPVEKPVLKSVSASGNFINPSTIRPVAQSVSKTRRICPVCKRVYSSKYNFCPYDGAQLVF